MSTAALKLRCGARVSSKVRGEEERPARTCSSGERCVPSLQMVVPRRVFELSGAPGSSIWRS